LYYSAQTEKGDVDSEGGDQMKQENEKLRPELQANASKTSPLHFSYSYKQQRD